MDKHLKLTTSYLDEYIVYLTIDEVVVKRRNPLFSKKEFEKRKDFQSPGVLLKNIGLQLERSDWVNTDNETFLNATYRIIYILYNRQQLDQRLTKKTWDKAKQIAAEIAIMHKSNRKKNRKYFKSITDLSEVLKLMENFAVVSGSVVFVKQISEWLVN